MLRLSKKFFDSTDYMKQGFKPCFNKQKNKLTFYKYEKTNETVTDLQEIAKCVNRLPKPIFKQVQSYCNLYKKIESVNELITPKKEISIDLESFNENFKPKTKDLNKYFLELSVLSRNVFQHLKDQIQIKLTSLLDKWIEEGLQEANRTLAKHKILDVFNKKETFLDLSGLDVSSLPDIFNMGDLQKLLEVDLSGNQLINLPESFGELSSLEWLYLASNNLGSFPKAITNLSSLKRLDLEDNKIAILPEVINLPLLENLNLNHNQLVILPKAISELRFLIELRLASNEFEILPETINELRSLEVLDLIDNPISGIPIGVLDLPNICEIDFAGCDFSESVLSELHRITSSPDYAGPRINFSVIDKTGNEEKSIENSLNELYCVIDQNPEKFPNLEKSGELRSWLHRLSDTSDYQKSGELQKRFACKIIEYLSQANKDQEFREVFYIAIHDASKTCGDRVALSVLRLGIAYRLATIDLKDMKKLADFLARGVWVIDMLENIARNKILTLPLFDEIEVYLGYPIKLKEFLRIPIDIEEMFYFTCSALKAEDLQEAKDFVENQLRNEEAYYEFLIRNDKWQEALFMNYKEEYEAISNKKIQDSELENPDYMAIEQKSREALKRLTRRVLSKREPSDNSLNLDKPKKTRINNLNEED